MSFRLEKKHRAADAIDQDQIDVQASILELLRSLWFRPF
jgi:hypothetical protein